MTISKSRRPWILALISGMSVGLAVYPVYWWWVFSLSLLGFFKANQLCSTYTQARLVGFVYGVSVMATTLNWLLNIFPLGLCATLFAIFGIIYAALSCCCHLVNRSSWHPIVKASCFALLWGGWEYFRAELWWLEFPWSTPGIALGPNLFSPLIGVYGISIIAALGAALFIQPGKLNRGLGALIIVFLIVAKWHQAHEDIQSSETIEVALVQNENTNYRELMEMSQIAAETDLDFVVWPEVALLRDPRTDSTQKASLDKFTSNGTVVVTGLLSNKDPGYKNRNTAITYSQGDTLGTHVKNHLVHFFNEGEKGSEAKAITTAHGKIGTPICFDGDFQDVYRAMTLDGATFFLQPTLDAIHWSRRQHLNHSELVRHRAAENGRWIGVAASSGLTQIINHKGQSLSRLSLITPAVLTGKLEPRQKLTFFTRYGWAVGPISVGLSLLIIPLAWRAQKPI